MAVSAADAGVDGSRGASSDRISRNFSTMRVSYIVPERSRRIAIACAAVIFGRYGRSEVSAS